MTKRTAPRPTSVRKAIDLLSSVKVTIARHGRPRRRPNIYERPTAVSLGGTKVSPVSPGAAKWSLVGAFRADAEALGVTKSIVHLAACSFEKAYFERRDLDYTPESKAVLDDEDPYVVIDVLELDDREITRALQRAVRNLQNGVFA